jgi:hypothetical protein
MPSRAIYRPFFPSTTGFTRAAEYAERTLMSLSRIGEIRILLKTAHPAGGREESLFPAPIYGAWNVGPMHLSQHRVNKFIPSLRSLRL